MGLYCDKSPFSLVTQVVLIDFQETTVNTFIFEEFFVSKIRQMNCIRQELCVHVTVTVKDQCGITLEASLAPFNSVRILFIFCLHNSLSFL